MVLPDSTMAEQTKSSGFLCQLFFFLQLVYLLHKNGGGEEMDERGSVQENGGAGYRGWRERRGLGDLNVDISMALIIGHSQANLAALLLKGSQGEEESICWHLLIGKWQNVAQKP